MALSVLMASLSSAINWSLTGAPNDPLSGTYHEIRVQVEIGAGETSIVETWLESRSPSRPSDELDIESFNVPSGPPPMPVVPEAELFCKFDSTHWKHGETVEFWLHATVWHNGQTTSVQPQLVATRTVYNAVVLIQHKKFSASTGGAVGFQTLNHTVIKHIVSNAWTANTVVAELAPATSHLILAHGSPGVIHAPAAPTTVNDAVVQAAVPGGPFPLYFAYLASCEVAQNDNAAVPNAYLSEAADTTNRCAVAFKVTLLSPEMLSLFFEIVGRVLAGKTVGVAAIEAWDASGLEQEYDGLTFENAILLTGDPRARPKWLYDQTHNTHQDWKRRT